MFILDLAVFHMWNIESKFDQSQTALYYALVDVLNDPCVQYTEKIIFYMWNIAGRSDQSQTDLNYMYSITPVYSVIRH